MKRVIEFFNSLKKNELVDEVHINKKNFRVDNVVKSLFFIGTTLFFNGISNEAFASKTNISVSQNYQKQGDELIRDMYIQGFLSDKYKMNVVKLSSNGDSTASILPGRTCKVSWALNKEGLAQSLIEGIDISQTPLYKDMALLHEVSHCELININNPFRNSGLKKESEKWINDWIIGAEKPHTPINNFFSENFADTYGMLMLLKENNFSKDSINELNRWYEIRKVKRELDERNGESLVADPHYTDFSLKQLIDRLSEVKEMSPVSYKDLALEISSHSMLEFLNKNRLVQVYNDNPSKKEVKPLGNIGINFLLGNIQSGQSFYDVLIGQAQLNQAKKQNIITNLPENDANKLLEKIILENNISSDGIKVKMNLDHNLRWDSSYNIMNESYITSILQSIDKGQYIKKWKQDNDWNSVADDINSHLTKKISYDSASSFSYENVKDKILKYLSSGEDKDNNKFKIK